MSKNKDLSVDEAWEKLLEKYDKLTYLYEILPFVAVGTIADVVPLIGENRF